MANLFQIGGLVYRLVFLFYGKRNPGIVASCVSFSGIHEKHSLITAADREDGYTRPNY